MPVSVATHLPSLRDIISKFLPSQDVRYIFFDVNTAIFMILCQTINNFSTIKLSKNIVL